MDRGQRLPTKDIGFMHGGQDVSIAPGMAVTAEVKMGQRRVIEFLLSPLLRYQKESGR